MQNRSKQLGEILMERGLITGQQLQDALVEHEETGKLLGRVLIDRGSVTEAALVRALAEQVGLEFVDLSEYPVDAACTALLPKGVARRYRAIPIAERDGKLLVAMSDPANVYALDDIRIITARDVQPVVSTASDVEATINKYSSMESAVEEVNEGFDADATEELEVVAGVAVEEGPIVRLVTQLIKQSVVQRASDIHIEPTEHDIRVRLRVDGVLTEVMRSPKSIQAALMSRLKVMADMNIAETRMPQDGRVSVKSAGRTLDLRVATLPTVYGERVMIRVLDKSQAIIELSALGMLEVSYRRYEEAFRKPYGAVLVCGPTGSGKTTTMYATLALLNDAEKNVITVEDPVEYRMKGVNQIQIQPAMGLTFARSLRAILRADPDILLIGEMRDRETALIGVEAALTGHMVLSSLHTNDAPSALTRLTEMEVETFLIASAVECIVAQRLARILCEKCKEAYVPATEELAQAGYPEALWPEIGELFRPIGCKSCANTGFRGRIGIYEVLRMSEEIKRLTVERAPSTEIVRMAVEQGMIPLRTDGLEKARSGTTSIAEVLRVVV